MLRAVRFAARFDFEIEEETAAAMLAGGGDLAGVSRERIGGEIRRMLEHPSRARACELLERFRLDAPVLLGAERGAGGHAALQALGEVSRSPVDGLSAWIIDREDEAQSGLVDRLRRALLLSNQEHSDLLDVLECHRLLLSEWNDLGVAGRKRLAVRRGFETALLIASARASDAVLRITEDLEPLRRDGLAPDALIDGNDLIEAGLTPGPRFKAILDAVYDAQLEGVVTDRDQALARARALGTPS